MKINDVYKKNTSHTVALVESKQLEESVSLRPNLTRDETRQETCRRRFFKTQKVNLSVHLSSASGDVVVSERI